jgi:GTPase
MGGRGGGIKPILEERRDRRRNEGAEVAPTLEDGQSIYTGCMMPGDLDDGAGHLLRSHHPYLDFDIYHPLV